MYIIWSCFLLHKFKMMISLDAFLKFSKFWFWFVRGLGEGVKRQKMAQNGKKMSYFVSQELYLIWLWFLVHMSKVMISPAIFFGFFKILIFRVFQSSSINAKRKFWCVPHFLHMCVIFTDYALLTFCKIKLVKYWLKVLFFHCLLKNLFLSLFFTSRYMVYVRWYCAKFHKVKSSNIHIAWQF